MIINRSAIWIAMSIATTIVGGAATSLPATQPAAAASSTSIAVTAANQLARGYTVPSKREALARLSRVRVAQLGSMAGYSETSSFPHWRDASTWGWPVAPSNRCNARNAALYRDGVGVRVNASCAVVAGKWLDPYTATWITSKRGMDIDHQVARAMAWRTGASHWPLTKRIKFANDPLVLVSVSSSANRSKGDKGPDLWKPPNGAAVCLFAKRYTTILGSYGLTATAPQKVALNKMLNTCSR